MAPVIFTGYNHIQYVYVVPPSPNYTYTVTANTNAIIALQSVTYTITTSNVPLGTTLYYTLNNSSQTNAADFTSASNGSVITSGAPTTFTLTAAQDTDATDETITIDVRTDSLTGNIVASNSAVTVTRFNANVTYHSSVDSGSAGPGFTFNAVSIGDESSDRIVAIAVHNDGSNPATVVSANIAGIPASIVTVGASASVGTSIFYAVVPTGNTANVTLRTSVGVNRIRISSFSIRNTLSTTPIFRNTNASAGSVTTRTTPLTSTLGTVGVSAVTVNASGNRVTWSNATEVYDSDVDAGNTGASGALLSILDESLSVTTTFASDDAAMVSVIWK